MTDHVDLRVLRTRASIERALLVLLRTTTLDKITVGELCEVAYVNKGTFYRHFQDKYDLAASTARELLDEFGELVSKRIDEQVGTGSASGGTSDEDKDSRSPRADDARLSEIMSELILLAYVEVDGKTTRDRVRGIIADALRPMAEKGLVSEDVETEAWVLTMIVFDYPSYEATVSRPVRPSDYLHAVQEVSDVYERVFLSSN